MRRSILLGLLLASAMLTPLAAHGRSRPAPGPALIGRCASPDGAVADTPCVDDADCPEGHVCSVSAFHPGS